MEATTDAPRDALGEVIPAYLVKTRGLATIVPEGA